MGHDPLYQAIEQALAAQLDPNVFESCAASLLRGIYPELVPVKGGGDAGMDGYVGPASGEGIVLVSTTSAQHRANLTRNLTSYLASGGAARRAVFATSRFISGTKRRNLENAAAQQGFTLIQIFDGAWFADELVYSPRWRQELLGLTGHPPALSQIPFTRLSSVPIPLLGRESEVASLKDMTGDLVLVGEPGAGKSALLRELSREDWGLFCVDYDRGRLADAIRKQKPSRIVIDDAHFFLDRLRDLRQMRDELEAEFAIVAVTWPGHADDVSQELPFATKSPLKLLPRNLILRIVEEVGVQGPRELQRLIVDQARGRPGLATILATLSLRGSLPDVASGEALFRESEVTYRRLLGDRSAVILGIISLSGDAGITLETIADLTGIDIALTQHLTAGLAAGGTIDETRQRRLVVQPEQLRYAAVRKVFFGGPASMNIARVLAALEEPGAALPPLVAATHRGAVVPDSTMRNLLKASPTVRGAEAYATLGERQAQFAYQFAPGAVARIALHHSPRWAVQQLMSLATGDNRPRHSHPDHPMRQIADWIAAGGSLERIALLGAAKDWIRSGNDGNIALESLAYALSPQFGDTLADAGLGNTITIRRGMLDEPNLRAIAAMGQQAANLLPIVSCTNYSPLIETLGDWLFPGRAGIGGGTVSAKTVRTAKQLGRTLVLIFVKAMAGHQGVLARLDEMSRQARVRTTIPADEDFRVLFPLDTIRTDFKKQERERARQANDLAQRLLGRPVPEVVDFLTSSDANAIEAGITYPRLLPDVCASLAKDTTQLHEFTQQMLLRSAAPDMVVPFLEAGLRVDLDGFVNLVEHLLQGEKYKTIAVYSALTSPVPETLIDKAVTACDWRERNLLQALTIQQKLEIAIISKLLDHPDLVVSRTVGVHLPWKSGLPKQIRSKWERMVVLSPTDDYWHQQILISRPDLLENWLVARIARQSQPNAEYERIPESVAKATADLPLDKRRRILIDLAKHPTVAEFELASDLIGEDQSLVELVFSMPSLKRYQSATLRGNPSPEWLRRAQVALQNGWTPQEVVEASLGHSWFISGPESEYWRHWVTGFRLLASSAEPGAKALGEVGIDVFSRRQERAAEEEHAEAVYGY